MVDLTPFVPTYVGIAQLCFRKSLVSTKYKNSFFFSYAICLIQKPPLLGHCTGDRMVGAKSLFLPHYEGKILKENTKIILGFDKY